MHMRECLTFDDVSLVPQLSEIPSRDCISLCCGEELNMHLTTPIISANMESVTGIDMCIAMWKAGGVAILHRFHKSEVLLHSQLSALVDVGCKFIPSIGVNELELWKLDQYEWAGCKMVCIDVAHGHHQKVRAMIEHIKNNYKMKVIAGNVATKEATKFLCLAGADIIKIGIGPGSHCTTRVVTGHGVPQLTAILDCQLIAAYHECATIADGGIRNSGDIAKSIAAGAKYVMVGRLLAPATESNAELVYRDGRAFKVYMGSASHEARKRSKYVEGVHSEVPYCGQSVRDIISELSAGLRSALSYSGVWNLDEFRQKREFVRITHNSYIEGTPHGA